jgi:hypothetical protein
MQTHDPKRPYTQHQIDDKLDAVRQTSTVLPVLLTTLFLDNAMQHSRHLARQYEHRAAEV